MVSGEFHYFRVPKSDWERRLILFKEAGGNTVATYVPWCIHEQVEGDIRSDDCEERDLSDFLRLCDKLNIKVMVRPGPYQYSELSYDGLPSWLYENYPEVRAVTENGEFFDFPVFSYCNPLFLEKTKKYYDAFCKVVKPFLVTKGGPVVMIQLDNELTGVHLWRGSLDYNENAMEIEKKGGKYSQFLKNKYTYIEKLNKAYNTNYADFDDVRPQKPVGSRE
jgi:beta-galactosidase